MKTFKTTIDEVAQPLSQGEKNFKGLHNPVKADKLVPGVTDQEHVFKGLARKLDQPTASYEIYKSEDESKENYDKGLKVKEEPYAEEVEHVEEAKDKKWTAAHTAYWNDLEKQAGNILHRDKVDKIIAAKKAAKQASKVKEEVEVVDEKHLTPNEMKKREEIIKSLKKKGMEKAKAYAIATATAKKVTEDVDYDYEGEMAKTELRAICDKSDKLANMMRDDMNLEAWLQSKISRAKDHIDAVYDYMMYKDSEDVPAAVAAAPSQSSSMAGTYGSFLNRMGEEVEHVDETSLAALAPPKDKVTKKDILVGRGVLKKHPTDPNKHVVAKEDIEIASPALRKAFERKI